MFDFKITPEAGDPFEVTATSRDIVQWERRNKGASITALREQMRMTDLYKIAHLAAERTGKFHGSEAEFMDYVDLELLDDDEEDDDEVPTPSAA